MGLGIPSNPMGIPSNPLGIQSNPMGIPSNPMGIPSNPRGIPSNPVGFLRKNLPSYALPSSYVVDLQGSMEDATLVDLPGFGGENQGSLPYRVYL